MKPVLPRVLQLRKSLRSKQSQVRYDAVEALRRIDDPIVVPALIEMLNDENEGIRASAARALGEIYRGTQKTVLALIKTLRDESALVRYYGVEALRKIEDPDVVPALIDLLDDEASFIRHSTVVALNQIGTRKALQAVNLFQNEKI